MKKHIMKSIIIILILVSLFILFMSRDVYATTTDPSFSLEKIFTSLKEFLAQGTSQPGDIEAGTEIAKEVQPIINMLYWVGVAVVIGASMFLGIQYFKATGDPKTKAELQSKLIGFLISAAVLLAAYPIWNYLIGLLSKIIN